MSAVDTVAEAWTFLLEEADDLVDPAMVCAAYAQPRLRELLPGVSHGILFFKRNAEGLHPSAGGYVYPMDNGRFRARGPLNSDGALLGGPATAEEAFALVAANLPTDCGPAVLGKYH